MPVVKPSFQSESRLGPPTSRNYNSLVANFHLSLLALVALLGARYIYKISYKRRQTSSTRIYYSTRLSAPEFIWPTEEKSRGVSTIGGTMSAGQDGTPFMDPDLDSEGWLESNEKQDPAVAETSEASGIVRSSPIVQRLPIPLLSRPPPPPPLSLTEFSTGMLAFDGRRRSFPSPALPSIDTNAFIHQPNPDYLGESSTTAVAQAAPSLEDVNTATTPRRRSYAKAVAKSATAPSAGVELEVEFAPNSFPSASTHLPPAAEFPEIGHSNHEVDLQGEIVSSFDNRGHGWKRHTRVYGGGVCLACLHAGGEGGFYGENVRPEDRH